MSSKRSPDGTDDQPQSGVASYEQARDELADVVARLEAGGLGLEDSLTLWERGEQLARQCGEFLDGARERVDAALERADQDGDDHIDDIDEDAEFDADDVGEDQDA